MFSAVKCYINLSEVFIHQPCKTNHEDGMSGNFDTSDINKEDAAMRLGYSNRESSNQNARALAYFNNY